RPPGQHPELSCPPGRRDRGPGEVQADGARAGSRPARRARCAGLHRRRPSQDDCHLHPGAELLRRALSGADGAEPRRRVLLALTVGAFKRRSEAFKKGRPQGGLFCQWTGISGMIDLQSLIDEIHADLSTWQDRGKVATYIPELAKVNPEAFGIAIATVDGAVHVAGDADEPFSIQSISKVFTLTLALGKIGDRLWTRVGREPSGSAFNSIVQLEYEQGKPRNPFINAGALVVADVVLAGHQPKEAIGEI